MFSNPSLFIQQMLMGLPGIIIAITFHEAAHGYAAESMGDPTAKNAGRLTLNPLAHMDPIGFLCLVFLRFGWAKPVPVNPNNFSDRKKGIILVSLAGCLTNLLLGFIGMAAYLAVQPLNNTVLSGIMQNIYYYNVLFAIFNLIPIPPLDGSRILAEFLPYEAAQKYESFSRYGFIVLMILMVTGVFSMIITPIVNGISSLFFMILSPIISFFWGL